MAKKEKKVEEQSKGFAPATEHDYEVILTPVITEKSMALIQNSNKVTVKVAKSANKVEIKESFQRIFQVPVDGVNVSNMDPKEKSRGGRYKGTVSGYKKAVVSIAKGAALDLFHE